MKKLSKKLGVGGILASFFILGAVCWYATTLYENSLVFCVCIVLLAAVTGYLLVLHEKVTAEKNEMMLDKMLTQLTGVEANLQNAMTAQAEAMTNNFNTVTEGVSKQNEELKAKSNEIINAIATNEQARKEDVAKANQKLEGIAKSFKNAVEAYQEMERRMAALEQQNVHLQMLTTMIGTVRSDIATINEVKGFVAEANAGRKIRIVRDDENKIVVESLMNTDGVRIEKSKMYRNKQLAFEAVFDSAGKMIKSRSYSNGELSTEVTYAPENNGAPTIRDVMKEKISGAFGKKR